LPRWEREVGTGARGVGLDGSLPCTLESWWRAGGGKERVGRGRGGGLDEKGGVGEAEVRLRAGKSDYGPMGSTLGWTSATVRAAQFTQLSSNK